MICGAIITAGGTGTRMGSDIPKQYLTLNGIPILVRTLKVFQDHPDIDTIIVTVPPGDEKLCLSEFVSRFELTKVRDAVAGGTDRQASVYNGLACLADTDLVAIHDGARPLVSQSIVSRTIEAARSTGAALAGIRVRQTVKRVIGSHLETIPRSDLWVAHTPQTFRTDLIIDAHRRARDDEFTGTDDASLVERLGHPVRMVEDSDENIKITTPKDLEFAGMMLGRA
jgi:2-C-methyl-D-erythritol 4-phosphate cytidylyltransferase